VPTGASDGLYIYRGNALPDEEFSGGAEGNSGVFVTIRPKDLRVKPCAPCELLGIDLIGLAIAVRDRPQFTDVGYDDLVS
jgi:hypothetical protein